MLDISTLSQRDPHWKDIRLGFGDDQTTIGTDGCTLTCLTMVANGYGFQETPVTLNDRLKSLGPGRGFSGPLIVWGGLPLVLSGIVLARLVDCTNVPAPMDVIDAALSASKPVIVELDSSPAPGLQNHWVVISGRRGDDYVINDPWPYPVETSVLLSQRYGYGRTIAQIITYIVQYEGPDTSPAGDSTDSVSATTDGTEQLEVIVNDDDDIHSVGGLRLRETPVYGAVLQLLAAGTPLKVAESADEAHAKIGVADQWLHVRSQQGILGYVAAWYVHVR